MGRDIESIAVTYFLTAKLHRKGTVGAPEANHALWGELLDGPQKTLIVNGNPHIYERNRIAITRGKILRLDGTLQNQDNVVTLKHQQSMY